jgi:hypothetical protein
MKYDYPLKFAGLYQDIQKRKGLFIRIKGQGFRHPPCPLNLDPETLAP